MSGVQPSPEERREQNKRFIGERWRSWGAKPDEVLAVTGQKVADALGLEEPPTEEALLDAADVVLTMFKPTNTLLDAVKEARGPEEPSA